MHATAMEHARRFFESYVPIGGGFRVLEIGSLNVNGTIRDVCPRDVEYIGVDCEPGRDVDVVVQDPYKLPFQDDAFNVAVSSSCFEHCEMFWVLYLEVMRVLAPSGLFWLNAPSVCGVHRFPVDCWRFNPDCGSALVKWGRLHGHRSAVLESYLGSQAPGVHLTDYVCTFIKDEDFVDRYPKRVVDLPFQFTEGFVRRSGGNLRAVSTPMSA